MVSSSKIVVKNIIKTRFFGFILTSYKCYFLLLMNLNGQHVYKFSCTLQITQLYNIIFSKLISFLPPSRSISTFVFNIFIYNILKKLSVLELKKYLNLALLHTYILHATSKALYTYQIKLAIHYDLLHL